VGWGLADAASGSGIASGEDNASGTLPGGWGLADAASGSGLTGGLESDGLADAASGSGLTGGNTPMSDSFSEDYGGYSGDSGS
jgi:hypothetical protein